MREIGGAVGIAAVSTVLVARHGLAGFHAAFVLAAAMAVLGAVVAAVAFPRVRAEEAEVIDLVVEELEPQTA
jgi:hypothetical protein